MSTKLIDRLNTVNSYKVDSTNKTVLNLHSVDNINANDFYKVKKILDTSHFSYAIDGELNFILI